jgi:regulator of RNase E activity RraB
MYHGGNQIFLCRYVEKVPLAAKILDARESQKLKIIESLKLERQRLRFEAEIGKAPPLSDDELSEHIREEAYVFPLFPHSYRNL